MIFLVAALAVWGPPGALNPSAAPKMSSLSPLLLETFLGVKHWELETAAGDTDLVATCARYASAY